MLARPGHGAACPALARLAQLFSSIESAEAEPTSVKDSESHKGLADLEGYLSILEGLENTTAVSPSKPPKRWSYRSQNLCEFMRACKAAKTNNKH